MLTSTLQYGQRTLFSLIQPLYVTRTFATAAAATNTSSSTASSSSSSSTSKVPPVLSSTSSSSSLPSYDPIFAPSTDPSGRIKYKNAFKRASSVMAAVTKQSIEHMNVKYALTRPPIPPFRVGDAIEISYALETADTTPMPVRGTVMGKWNRGLDSKFTIINSSEGEWFTASYVYNTPLLRSISIMQRNRVNDGLKRARRAKLTHLLAADSQSYIVGPNTKEASVLQAEKEKKRALQRSGKALKKKSERSQVDSKAGGAAKGAAAAKGGAKGAAPAAKAAPAKAPAKK